MLNTERQRLQAANRFLKLEISKEPELRDLVLLAATICQTPTALLTLVDQDGAYQTFWTGTSATVTIYEEVFCQHVIRYDRITIIPDTQLDEQFADTLALTEDEGIRFYAGVPLKTYDGISIGALGVIDTEPRQLNQCQIDMLQILSKQAVHIFELDHSLHLLRGQFEEAKNVEIKFEERMTRQNEMLRKIAYVQSHEFRRPVASILGLMNVIKLEGDGCDHKESLRMMEAAVLELDEKIHDIVNHIYAPDLLQIG